VILPNILESIYYLVAVSYINRGKLELVATGIFRHRGFTAILTAKETTSKGTPNQNTDTRVFHKRDNLMFEIPPK
jgi:hypothetical protein